MRHEKPPITARQLMALLEQLPEDKKDLVVWSEGCDCDGEAAGILVDDDRILLFRA